MPSRRTILLSMLSTGAFALAFRPSARAADGCTELEECLPEIERVFEEELHGDALVALLFEAADEADPPGADDLAPDEGEGFDDAPKLRKGQAGDVLKAAASDATVKKMFDSIKDKTLEKVTTSIDKLKTGEKIAALVFAAPVAAGVVASVLQSPSLYRPAQSFINSGINYAIAKKAPWLKLSVDLVSPNKVITLQVDVMQLLRKAGVSF